MTFRLFFDNREFREKAPKYDDPSVSIIQYMKNETKTTEQSLKRLYQHDE